MLRLDLDSGPKWIDLGHGVRVKALPMSTAIMFAARNDPAVQALVKNHAEEGVDDAATIAVAKVVARMVIQDWEGVGDKNGKPAKVTPEGIDALLDVWPIFAAFQAEYVAKGHLLDAEKNASAPLPTGTSAGAKTTARRARKPAKSARRG